MQVLTAPGVMIHEIDKSQYSPAMENTCCFIMGFANRGEVYQPQEFTSRTAWLNYYGEPDTEAERYFYAAACEVLNQNGRLYCTRLPYDNVSFEKVAAFKYKISANCDTINVLSSPFYPIYEEDDTLKDVIYIEPTDFPSLFDLSAIDEYRTDEAKVPNNTFLVADIAFNCYNRIQEDKNRKDENRELIGIMPVITTAANAMYTQGLINVDNINVHNYETIGEIRTLNAKTVLTASEYEHLSSRTLLTSDCAAILNSRDHYTFVSSEVVLSSITLTVTEAEIQPYNLSNVLTSKLRQVLINKIDKLDIKEEYKEEWNGQFEKDDDFENNGKVQTSIRNEKSIPVTDPRYGWHNFEGDDDLPDTVSLEANSYFPTLNMFTDEDGVLRVERQHMKKIGLVVYKMYMDPTEGNKISFEAVEAYAGSLGKDDKDPDTGVTTFLDTIVNSQSDYVNFFSNCFNTVNGKKLYNEVIDLFVVKPPKKYFKDIDNLIYLNQEYIQDSRDVLKGIWSNNADKLKGWDFDDSTLGQLVVTAATLEDVLKDTPESDDYKKVNEIYNNLNKANSLLVNGSKEKPKDDTTASLGFYWSMVKEDISIDKSIYDGINKSLTKVSDINERNIDIVCDAGLANIASYLKAIYGNKGEYDLGITDDIGNSLLGMWKCNKNNAAVKTWKTVEQKFDNFCKNVRKDCMFIADGLRPLVLQGQKKIVRETKPTNTIDSNILPYVKFITGLNTSYGAGYLDWFEQADDYSGDFFWCPPSIKAMGVYLNTDSNYMYWDAPAGLNRGVIAATDVAFSPTMAQAGSIYEKNWNYAVNYPQDGIVLEGQKTFQV